MKKNMKTLVIGLAAVALMAATSVQAQWASFWDIISSSPIDEVTATITGSTFTYPGYQAEFFDGVNWPTPLPGWATIDNGGETVSTMSGPAVAANTYLYFWDNVSSAITVPFSVDQKSYDAGTLVDEVIISYDGSGTIDYNVPDHPWNNVGFSVSIPDGGTTLMLLGSSLAGLACLRRRFGRC